MRSRGRGKSSGVEVEDTSANVWTIRDGKAVAYRLYRDQDEALEAAGLPAKRRLSARAYSAGVSGPCGATVPPSGSSGKPASSQACRPPDEVVGVVAAGAEGLRRERRPAPHPAQEDDGPVLVDLRRPARQVLELDVDDAGDAPGVVLVLLANVDELRLAALEHLRDAFGLQLVFALVEGHWQRA